MVIETRIFCKKTERLKSMNIWNKANTYTVMYNLFLGNLFIGNYMDLIVHFSAHQQNVNAKKHIS